jgi:hypothetical protein
LITIKPKIIKAVNPNASKLKYLSINFLMPGPNFHISQETKKNLALLLINEANKNMNTFIWNTPEVIVKTLYGIGVNPAVKITQKFHLSNIAFIW